ncbi:hypothetical protein ACN28S_45400 [Cystobacter fuscus]
MGRWHGAWALGVCLALIGCGSPTPAPSPETPGNGERTGIPPGTGPGTPSPAPDGSTPSDGGGAPPDEGSPAPTDGGTPPGDGGTPSPLEAEPSLPPRACIPWTYTTPPVRATACEVSSEFADGTTQRARYDADSRPLELRTYTATGALVSVETHTGGTGSSCSVGWTTPMGGSSRRNGPTTPSGGSCAGS